jgi:hypothetical protein
MSLHPNAPRCQHVRTNGVRCGSPAMRNRKICYYHHRTTSKPKTTRADMPSLEDGNAIQLGIANVLRQLMMGTIEYRAAYLMLYGYRLALRNLRNMHTPYYKDVITVDPYEDPDNAGLVSEPVTYDQQEELTAEGAFDPAKIAEYESIAAAIVADKAQQGTQEEAGNAVGSNKKEPQSTGERVASAAPARAEREGEAASRRNSGLNAYPDPEKNDRAGT